MIQFFFDYQLIIYSVILGLFVSFRVFVVNPREKEKKLKNK